MFKIIIFREVDTMMTLYKRNQLIDNITAE